MVNRKSVRTRGKLQLSRYFKKFEEGDSVAVTINESVPFSSPKRMQGRTGIALGKRGSSYVVEIKDMAKSKQFIIAPIHLKKIEASKKKAKEDTQGAQEPDKPGKK
jgi:large subunit ribosomal protein L21e